MSADLSTARTLSQMRAQHAWKQVEGVTEGEIEQYAAEAKKLPFQIRNAGLLQTMAFYQAKKKASRALGSVESWLVVRKLVAPDSLFATLRQGGSAMQLREITREALAYLEWIVRFSEARDKEREEKAKKTGGKQ